MADRPPRRRPRNRKQLIVAAAAKQFERRGFHDVAIADIVAEVGITGPALYRHFRGKSDLLVATVELELEQLEAAYGVGGSLRELLDEACRVTLRPGRVASLWQRNRVFLAPDDQAALDSRYYAALEPLRKAIIAERPALDERKAQMLTW